MRQLTYNDVLDARTPNEVNNVSLVRARRQVRRDASFGVVMSYQEGGSAEHNMETFRKLDLCLRSSGYGQLPLSAHWTNPGSGQVITAPARFVPGLALVHALRILRKFDQAAVVYAGQEHAGKVALHHRDGTHKVIGRFHPGNLATAYARAMSTAVPRLGLYFEARPASMIEAILESARAARERPSFWFRIR